MFDCSLMLSLFMMVFTSYYICPGVPNIEIQVLVRSRTDNVERTKKTIGNRAALCQTMIIGHISIKSRYIALKSAQSGRSLFRLNDISDLQGRKQSIR